MKGKEGEASGLKQESGEDKEKERGKKGGKTKYSWKMNKKERVFEGRKEEKINLEGEMEV